METSATQSHEKEREETVTVLPELTPTSTLTGKRLQPNGPRWTREQAAAAARLPRRTRSLWTKVVEALDEGETSRQDGKVSWTRARDALAVVLCSPEHPAYAQAVKLASERFDPVAKYVVKQELRTSYRINDNDAPRTIEATPASPQLTTGSTSETSSGPIQEAVQQRTTTPATELPGSALAPELPVSHPATGGVSEIATGAPTDLEQLRAEVHDLKALTRQLLEQNAKLLAKLG